MSDSKNSKSPANETANMANETAKDESHLTDLYVYRVLNSFKEAKSIDGKKLTKEHGGSPHFWGNKKSIMVRSTIPYALLKEARFAEAEIANWVRRPDAPVKKTHAPAKKDVAPAKTALTEEKEAELPAEEPPMGTPLHGAVYQQLLQGSALFSPLVQGNSHSKSCKGYSEAELMQMDALQLMELGLAKGQDALFVVSQGENGRIIFVPVQ
jgi:hypothetical protein